MHSTIIRYSKVAYGNNKIRDYYLSGLGKNNLKLSKNGLSNILLYQKQFKNMGIKNIIYSPETRCVQTANSVAKIIRCPSNSFSGLRSIPHDIQIFLGRKINTKSTLSTRDLIKMRTNFITCFWNNNLPESKEGLVKRLTTVSNYCDTHSGSLLISHGLFMKLFYLYRLTNFDCSLKDLIKYADVTKPFYGPLQGCRVVDKNLSLFDVKDQTV
jgi:broad specificity phosphatase PhoE